MTSMSCMPIKSSGLLPQTLPGVHGTLGGPSEALCCDR